LSGDKKEGREDEEDIEYDLYHEFPKIIVAIYQTTLVEVIGRDAVEGKENKVNSRFEVAIPVGELLVYRILYPGCKKVGK